jgi:hypothetical protein
MAIAFAFIAIIMVLGPIVYPTSHTAVDTFGQKAMQYTQYFLMDWIAMNFLLFGFLEIIQVFLKPFAPSKRIFLTEGLARGLVAGTTLKAWAFMFLKIQMSF